MCVERNRGAFKQPQLLLDALLEACKATHAERAGCDLCRDLTSSQMGGCNTAVKAKYVFGFKLMIIVLVQKCFV